MIYKKCYGQKVIEVPSNELNALALLLFSSRLLQTVINCQVIQIYPYY